MASEEEMRTKDKSKKDKKEKKDKKRSESDGVHKPKKDKKDKKTKDEKLKKKVEAALEEQLQADAAKTAPAPAAAEDSEADDHPGSDVEDIKNPAAKTSIVFFALPLADEKAHKKIYKAIKKARKAGALQRGVKEVNKAIRKTPPKTPSTADKIPGVAVIAGDISPDEVIMHLPLYCEEHNVPYIFVTSRLELGAAAKTKRPTSVVFLTEKGKPPKKAAGGDTKMGGDDDEDAGDYPEAYKEIVKLVQKEYGKQMKEVLKNGGNTL